MFVCATEVCWRTGNMSSSIRRAQQGACACVQAAWNARVHSHAAACNHVVAAVVCDRMCLRSPSEPCCVTKYWCMCFALEVCATTVCSTLVSSRAGQRQSHAVCSMRALRVARRTASLHGANGCRISVAGRCVRASVKSMSRHSYGCSELPSVLRHVACARFRK